jgi:hypothetical protein
VVELALALPAGGSTRPRGGRLDCGRPHAAQWVGALAAAAAAPPTPRPPLHRRLHALRRQPGRPQPPPPQHPAAAAPPPKQPHAAHRCAAAADSGLAAPPALAVRRVRGSLRRRLAAPAPRGAVRSGCVRAVGAERGLHTLSGAEAAVRRAAALAGDARAASHTRGGDGCHAQAGRTRQRSPAAARRPAIKTSPTERRRRAQPTAERCGACDVVQLPLSDTSRARFVPLKPTNLLSIKHTPYGACAAPYPTYTLLPPLALVPRASSSLTRVSSAA